MDYISFLGDFFYTSVSLLFLGLIVYLITRALKINLKGFNHFDKPKQAALWSILAVSFGMLSITFIMFLAWGSGHSSAEGTESAYGMYNLSNIISLGIIWLLTLSPIFIVKRIRKESWSSVGISKHNLTSSIIVGFGVSFLVFITLLGYSLINSGSISISFNSNHLTDLIFYAIVGFGEEFMFRGYLQTRLVAWLGYKGWILTSILMAIIHIPQRMGIQGLSLSEALFSSLILIPISLFLGYMYIRTENLVAPGIYHTFADWLWLLFSV